MGGRALLTGSQKWLTGTDPKKVAKLLPMHSVTVQALDFSNVAVNYDGVNNFGIYGFYFGLTGTRAILFD
jgi:hypothetical protein